MALDPASRRIYAAGGLTGGEASDSVEAFVSGGQWERVAPLPSGRFNLALVAVRGRLLAIGGSGQDRRPSASVFAYDPQPDRWSAVQPLPRPLSNFGAASLGERVVHAVLHTYHYVLDVQVGTWANATPMPTSRHGLGRHALSGALYAVGGCSEDPQRDLPTVEVFLP